MLPSLAAPSISPWLKIRSDAVLLAHSLETHENPHGLLREVDRILRPDGQLIVLGFNPRGIWGLRRLIARGGFPPGARHLISDHRLTDWLRLLNFRVHDTGYYHYQLTFGRDRRASNGPRRSIGRAGASEPPRQWRERSAQSVAHPLDLCRLLRLDRPERDLSGDPGPSGLATSTATGRRISESNHAQRSVSAVEIYTDGACRGNPGPGGWGVLLMYNGNERELCGGELATTNNRMELLAAIRALEALQRRCTVRLFTDSDYVRKGINEWITAWKSRGWRTSNRKTGKECRSVAAPG